MGPQKELLQKYGLSEGPKDTKKFVKRTMLNVDGSDATIAFRLKKSSGTDKTIGYAHNKKWAYPNDILDTSNYKPIFVIHNLNKVPVKKAATWLIDNNVKVLNVAGHREKSWPGLQNITKEIIKAIYYEQISRT